MVLTLSRARWLHPAEQTVVQYSVFSVFCCGMQSKMPQRPMHMMGGLGHWTFALAQPLAWWFALSLRWCVLSRSMMTMSTTSLAQGLRRPAGRGSSCCGGRRAEAARTDTKSNILCTRFVGQILRPSQRGVLLVQATISGRALVHLFVRGRLQQGPCIRSLRHLAAHGRLTLQLLHMVSVL